MLLGNQEKAARNNQGSWEIGCELEGAGLDGVKPGWEGKEVARWRTRGNVQVEKVLTRNPSVHFIR